MRALRSVMVLSAALSAMVVGVKAGGVETALKPVGQAKPMLNAAGEGRRAFLQYNCYGCHGMFAAGGMGPNIVHADKGDLSEAVKRGESGGMPSFAKVLTSTDINNLASYLRSIGTPAEPKFMDWWVAVPTK